MDDGYQLPFNVVALTEAQHLSQLRVLTQTNRTLNNTHTHTHTHTQYIDNYSGLASAYDFLYPSRSLSIPPENSKYDACGAAL